MDNTAKFTGKAEIYAKARPSYAPALFDYLYGEGGVTPAAVIADIGSGTGIFARTMLERGNTVYGIEPNDDMHGEAVNSLSDFANFRPVKGTAENTTLAAGSVDVVTAAQAFHWFDMDGFKTECQRIVKLGGKVVLVWNSRISTSALVKENAAIFEKYCPNFHGFSGGLKHRDADIARFFNGRFELKRFTNDLQFNKEKFIERCLSASYSLKETDSEYKNYIAELEELFFRFSIDNAVTMPNETVAYIGQL